MRRTIALCCVLITFFTLAGCSSAPLAANARSITQKRSVQAPAGPVYVAVGASDSFGIGANDPLTQSWPYDVAHKLATKPRLINLGIPGATTDLAVRAELPIAVSAQPTVVTVWLGVNDVENHVPLAAFSAQLQSLLSNLAQQTSAAIYVGNLPDLTALPYFASWDQTALAEEILAWNVVISEACLISGAHLVDIYSQSHDLTAHPGYLGSDQFHPSAQGAQHIADIFVAAMNSVSSPSASSTP